MSGAQHVLLLGGSGKISQLLTPMLLKRSWTVTSVIRNPDQVASLQKLGDNQSGKLNVLVRSLEDIKSEAEAKNLLDEVKPSYVVWSAGAGGKGGPERTFAVDRDAATHVIRAAAATPTVSKFVMVSFIGSRLRKPAWWTEEVWQNELRTTRAALPQYYEAKIAADQVLHEEGRKRGDGFAAVNLRPGRLTDEPRGPVRLGRIPTQQGTSSRESVAELVALVLDHPAARSAWLDMLDGDEDPAAAVDRCVKEGVDAAEGEPFY